MSIKKLTKYKFDKIDKLMEHISREHPIYMCMDIEISHSEVASFSLYPDSIPHENVLLDAFIICITWHFSDTNKVETAVIGKDMDEKPVIQKFIKAMERADFIVGHNHSHFDMGLIAARVMKYNLPPMPDIPLLDTLKLAKRHYKFLSNRLDYLGHYLGFGSKLKCTNAEWIKALKGDRKAIKKIVDYNINDVVGLQVPLWNRLLPYVINKVPSIKRWYKNRHNPICCNKKMSMYDIRHSKARGTYTRFECRRCGKRIGDK